MEIITLTGHDRELFINTVIQASLGDKDIHIMACDDVIMVKAGGGMWSPQFRSSK